MKVFKQNITSNSNNETIVKTHSKTRKTQNSFLPPGGTVSNYKRFLSTMGIQKEYDNAYKLLKLLGGEVEPDPNNPFLVQHVASLKMQGMTLSTANFLVGLTNSAYKNYIRYINTRADFKNANYSGSETSKYTKASIKPFVQMDIELLKKQSPLGFFSM